MTLTWKTIRRCKHEKKHVLIGEIHIQRLYNSIVLLLQFRGKCLDIFPLFRHVSVAENFTMCLTWSTKLQNTELKNFVVNIMMWYFIFQKKIV